uniref:Uncharacterized protein n=1 Tax=Anguilla anguilla TaxID=7936 RepID=A0A0E9PI15_ANGAN
MLQCKPCTLHDSVHRPHLNSFSKTQCITHGQAGVRTCKFKGLFLFCF